MAFTPGQQKCIDTLDRSLVVAAGAGSGKTFTLTKRIVHAIESGAVDGIERVCAITFTNKAAGELKSRIKSELRACGMAEQALKVDEAWVSTIHGMCARILRAHAVELDIDPKFKMADVAVTQQLQRQAVDAVLRVAMSGQLGPELGWPAREAVDALFAEYPARSGGRGVSVEAMLNRLMEAAGAQLAGFDAFTLPKASINCERVVLAVLEAFEALADATREQKPNASREQLIAAIEQLGPAVRSRLEGQATIDELEALRLLDEFPMPKRVGAADYKQQVGEVLAMYRTCVMELRIAAAAPYLDTLVALARQAGAAFARMKRDEGILDNNDLLVLASQAIRDYPDIAAQYADKFQLVMVDEFQDTDQMQVDMIKELAGPGACRLCTVGDAQQSIYRFRGADVSVYRRHLESVRADNPDDVILLPDNFRSHRDVLALVDRVFERPEMFGGEFMSLAPGRDEGRVKVPFGDGPRIRVQMTSKSSRGVSAAEMREVAAARIADVFADLHRQGHSAGEMAVLLGGMTYADIYARALRERGLACVIAGGSVFSHCSEAAVVLELARVFANPYQTQSLFNVLTSPLFELNAGDLLELTTYDENGAYRRGNLCRGLLSCARVLRDDGPRESWSLKLCLAVRVMSDFIGASGRQVTSRAIMRVVVESGWISRLQAHGAEGLASAANVYKAIRMIEGIEADRAAGPARTAALFQVVLEESKEAPGALSATGGDFVRIMTVHASKGLEFPIVAVGEFKALAGSAAKLQIGELDGRCPLSLDLANSMAELQGPADLKSVSAVYADMMADYADEDELLRVARDASSPLERRAALHERDRLGDVEEAKRLLYVALTRAKEALVVSLMGVRTKDNPQGVPKSCLGALVPALTGSEEGFEVGVSHFDFQGSAPALVEHVALQEATDVPAAEGEDYPGITEGGDAFVEVKGEPFVVPGEMPHVPVSRIPYAPAHEGVFSYSSIAEASHHGNLLAELAARFAVSVDAPSEGDPLGVFGPDSDPHAGSLGDAPDFTMGVARANRNAAVVDEDDGSWAYSGSLSADSDKATDLGTAFHRLAQYAVVTRGKEGVLARPTDEHVHALVRACNLDEQQRTRLEDALERWFGSGLAREMAAHEDVRAEVPFFVEVPTAVSGVGDGHGFLEGEIDLLALEGECAVVVDYKTGGSPGEDEETLRQKHVLQASCYAYALMRQGAREVQAVFARVERPRAGDDQPQCVRYCFRTADLPVLESAIAEVYSQA